MKKEEKREYQFLLTNGKVVYFTLRELQRFLVTPNVMFLLVIFLSIMTWGEAEAPSSVFGYALRMLYWGGVILIYVLALPRWISVPNNIWSRYTSMPMPLILGTGPLVVVLTVIASWLPTHGGQADASGQDKLAGLVFVKNIVAAHLGEMVAFLWLFPQFRQHTQRAQLSASVRFVRLGGRSLPTDSLKLVRNEEHYLVVNTTMGAVRIRARMKDLLMQVTEKDGIQTHRSFWVATSEAVELRGGVLLTRSGASIPVSRYRMKVVRDWVAELGLPH